MIYIFKSNQHHTNRYFFIFYSSSAQHPTSYSSQLGCSDTHHDATEPSTSNVHRIFSECDGGIDREVSPTGLIPFGHVKLASNEVSVTTNCCEYKTIVESVYAMIDDTEHVKRGVKRMICEEPTTKKIKLDTCEASINEVVDLTESDSDETHFPSSYDGDSDEQFSQFF